MSSFFQSLVIFIETKGTNILIAICALIFGLLIIKNLAKLITMLVCDSRVDKSMMKLLLTVIEFGLYFALLVYLLTTLGFGTSGIAAAVSALSVGLGFAVHDVIGGLASGLVIVSTRPFKVGDLIDVNGTVGTVKEINLMHTVVDTYDNLHVLLPNKSVYNSKVTNYSTNPYRRVEVDLCLDYDTDITSAKKLFQDYISNFPGVLKSPAPSVMFCGGEDSCIRFRLVTYAKTSDCGDVLLGLREGSFNLCKENGLEFPYPQVTISQRNSENAGKEAPRC